MGLVSVIPKLFNYGTKAVKYTGRAVKASPDIIFGKGAETFVNAAGKVTKGAGESWATALWRAVKTGGKAVETSIAKTKAVKGGFFKQGFNSLKSAPSVIMSSAKEGAKLAKAAGKSGIWGGVKGFFSGIGKKMPLIGNLMLVAMSLPNIITATKEQGIGQGIAEVAKTGAGLAGGALGGAIVGSAFGPIGSLVGWIAGEWLTSKIVGKSYTEQKAEAEEKLAEAAAQQQPVNPAFTGNVPQDGTQVPAPNQIPNVTNPMNPYNYNPYSFNDNYADDIFMQNMRFDQIA